MFFYSQGNTVGGAALPLGGNGCSLPITRQKSDLVVTFVQTYKHKTLNAKTTNIMNINTIGIISGKV